MTTVIRGTDNSVSAPAITGTDSDTGVYFPAANQMALATGGTQAVFIDSSQNVGIGTSSPASRLQISGTDSVGPAQLKITNTTASVTRNISVNNSGSLLFETAGVATDMTITSTGNVGIGGGVPASNPKLSLYGGIRFLATEAASATYTGIGSLASDAVSISSSGSERLRVDASGNSMFRNTGSTAPWDQNTAGQGAYVWLGNSTYSLGACNNNNIVAIMNRYQGSGVVIEIKNGTTVVGSISHNGTNTAYNTSSDYRLKHDIQPMTGGLSKIAQLKPVTYKWNADNSDGEGFIAHELAEVFPGAVTGEKDALKEDGSIDPQGIDTSFLVATLVTAIQELKAELEITKAKVAALEAKG